MDEIKLLKFETMIEDIDRKFHPDRESNGMNVALALIFDYDNCNEYAKKIFENTNLEIITYTSEKKIQNIEKFYILFYDRGKWNDQYSDINLFNNIKTRLEAAKSFIKYRTIEDAADKYSVGDNLKESYRFIFWSLFILTVDKTNAEEYLSTICDFAKMFKITNEEFKSIIDLIKCIYNRKGNLWHISKSDDFRCSFGNLFDISSGEYKL